MPIDPSRPAPTTPEAAQGDAIADLRRRVAVLAQASPTIQVGSGPPTIPATALREGTPYIDRSNLRLYVVVSGLGGASSANVWRYSPLT